MKTVYDFKNFFSLIRWRIKELNLNFRQVSKNANIHPSYFSRVMLEKGRFSQNQVFQIAEALKFFEAEQDYFILLWNLQDANARNEKQYYEKKVTAIRDEKLKVSANIDVPLADPEQKSNQLATYYAEAITAEIHMLLTIDRYRDNPECKISSIRSHPIS